MIDAQRYDNIALYQPSEMIELGRQLSFLECEVLYEDLYYTPFAVNLCKSEWRENVNLVGVVWGGGGRQNNGHHDI